MQRNFILTDVMKTGNHQDLESFISMHSLKNQQFDMTGEYYTLHNHDTDSYDRRFAIIDVRVINIKLQDNKEFHDELKRRCDLLHKQGFKFIKATPWESLDNITSADYYPEIDVEHIRWSGGVAWFWCYMYQKHKQKTHVFDHGKKFYDFLYLNKQRRPHRELLFQKVSEAGLLENSLYTKWPDVKLPKEYELPWAQDYPLVGMDQDLYAKPYNDTKYSLISETNVNDYEVFLTEKIWKAILANHIFVVHGNHLYLQKLREMGFKTFSKYFDESYDLEKDPDLKIEKIIGTCRELKGKNWQDLYLQTQALRNHNFNNFFDEEKLSEQVNNQLNLFLEFADSR